MKINYEKIRKNDTVVEIEPEEINVEVDFIDIKTYYLTPLEALLYAIVKKYGNYNVVERKWVKIPAMINCIFRHFTGTADIHQALDSLVAKRLLAEADTFPSGLDDIEDRILRLAK